MMDKWRHGTTPATLKTAEKEMTRMIQVWVPGVRGLELMSDLTFSQGIIRFHAGGHGRPEFTSYSYHYKGKAQPVKESNKALVVQAFIDARKEARGRVIPKEVIEWATQTNRTFQQILQLQKQF